jgi:chorismate synthase
MALRFLTAGESHGPQLTVIIEGVPAGLSLEPDDFAEDLARRQQGYGRGERQQIEKDVGSIVSGVRGGRTLGSPITIVLPNRDFVNWQEEMSIGSAGFKPKPVTRLRPGHADLAGVIKYGHDDVRNVLERASARETAARVAAGVVFRKLLAEFGIKVFSFTQSIGSVELPYERINPLELTQEQIESSPVRCPDAEISELMVKEIDEAKERGDTLGGTFRVIATGVPIGLGSYVHWDRKLDGLLAQAICSINAIKGVEFGTGYKSAYLPGSQVHDQIRYSEEKGFYHLTNTAGGLTGGVTNGEPLDLRAFVKPISTMRKPLESVDLKSKEVKPAHYERSDICVVPAAGVIGEAMVSYVLANAFVEKFGGDSITEMRRNYEGYINSIR